MSLSIQDFELYPQTSPTYLGINPTYEPLGGDATLVRSPNGVFRRDPAALYQHRLELVLKGEANVYGARGGVLTVGDEVIELALQDEDLTHRPFGPLSKGTQVTFTRGPRQGLMVHFLEEGDGLAGAQVRLGGNLGERALALRTGETSLATRITEKIASVRKTPDLHPSWREILDAHAREIPRNRDDLVRFWNAFVGRLTPGVRTQAPPFGFEEWFKKQMHPNSIDDLVRSRGSRNGFANFEVILGIIGALACGYASLQNSNDLSSFADQMLTGVKESISEIDVLDLITIAL